MTDQDKDKPVYELSFASTKELIREISTRFDHIMICGKKNIRRSGSKTRDKIAISWRGDRHTVVGIAMDAVTLCLADLNGEATSEAPEDF